MKDLEEIKQRVLSEVEEAGAEGVTCLMNTVLPKTGDEHELSVFMVALDKLVTEGLVFMAHVLDDRGRRWSKGLSEDESRADIRALSQSLRFCSEGAFWTADDETLPEREVVLTDAGRAKAEKILEDRGYQWWRSREAPPRKPISAIEMPAAFAKLCSHITADHENASPTDEKIVKAAIHGLSKRERAELAVFLDALSSGQYTENELQALWGRSSVRLPFAMEQIRVFLTLVRMRLWPL
jgi:hypothetical protein